MANDFLRGFDWDAFDAAAYTDAIARKMEPVFENFFMTKTKEELFAGAREMQYLLAPFSSVKDMLESPHFQARDLWVKIDHPELGATLTYPGRPFISSELSWKMDRRAPLIGEHNEEIYQGELGFTHKQLAVWKNNGVM
jgi:crotonobetainyl-CoA:carnitine CoA-transferase CaiB-like acyl-CoA transferase